MQRERLSVGLHGGGAIDQYEHLFGGSRGVGQVLVLRQADVVEAEVAGALAGGDHAAPVTGLAERGTALGQGEDTHLAAVPGGRQRGGAGAMVALAGVQRRVGRRLKN